MALIKPVNTETVALRIKFPKALDSQIQAYMRWVGVEDPSTFFQQAAEYILNHDKQWKTQQSNRSL